MQSVGFQETRKLSTLKEEGSLLPLRCCCTLLHVFRQRPRLQAHVVLNFISNNHGLNEYYMKALRIFKETGNLPQEGHCYCTIGLVYKLNDDIYRAEGSLKESLRCFEEVFKLLHYQDDYKVSIVDTYIHAYRYLTRVNRIWKRRRSSSGI